MNKKRLYENIMRNVSREVKRALNNHSLLEMVDQSLLAKAAKMSDDEIKQLKQEFDESNFEDQEVLRKLQRRRRQTIAFNRRIEELNDEAVEETTGKLKEIIEKWRDPIDLGNGVTINIGFEVEESEIIKTAEIRREGWGNNYYYSDPITEDPVYYYNLYVYITNDNFEETARRLAQFTKGKLGLTVELNTDIKAAEEIDLQINNIQEQLLNDLKTIGYELVGTTIERKTKNNIFGGMKCLNLSYKGQNAINNRLLKGFLNKDDKQGLITNRKNDKYMTSFYGKDLDVARINDKIKRTKRRL